MHGDSLPSRPLFWRMGPAKAAARQGRWKYVRQGGREMLFDLAADIGEASDCLEAHPDIAGDLRAGLAAWETDVDGR